MTTAQQWSKLLKERHHYGKSLEPQAGFSDKELDLVDPDDIKDIQRDALEHAMKIALTAPGLSFQNIATAKLIKEEALKL